MLSSLKQQLVLAEHSSGLEASDLLSRRCSSVAVLHGCPSKGLGAGLRPLGLPAHAGSSPFLPNFITSHGWADLKQLLGMLQAAQMVSSETS